MRGKRSKQYRKLMNQYGLSFNFREPYQVLVDAEMIQDAARFKMNLPLSLERTLHGKIKPMITQCCIRHLYTADASDTSTKNAWIDTAKTFERRRCNHHELPEPLTALECLDSVVDPKSSGTNRHRYVVASQDQKVRSNMRDIAGVPLVYINRSVMIMEPMAQKTEEVRDREERSKFRAGLKGRRGQEPELSLKRKRANDGEDDVDDDEQDEAVANGTKDVNGTSGEAIVRKKRKGPKGPNPLSVKKAKKSSAQEQFEQDKQAITKAAKHNPQAAEKAIPAEQSITAASEEQTDVAAKRKRRRKHKSTAAEPASGLNIETVVPVDVGA